MAYIKGASVISPQETFNNQKLPESITAYADVNLLKCIEPAYREYIDPMVARRMSRIVKMGVCSALKCLRDTNIEIPDAIIAGTGLGCLEDTEKFLASIITNEEKLLNPTPFIQSTHNTIAGAIALAVKCHNYNATYTHRGFSFESALEDAMLQLREDPSLNILAGGFDEITPGSFEITRRLGLSKNHFATNTVLKDYSTRGSLPGEGVAFFMLSGEKGDHDLAILKSMDMFYKPADQQETEGHISRFLSRAGLNANNIDLVIYGLNGDVTSDKVYCRLAEGLFNHIPGAWYKHLCGEYDTSSSFAMWLASMILNEQHVPAYLGLDNKIPEKINHVLIYNHLRGVNHSMYLLERC